MTTAPLLRSLLLVALVLTPTVIVAGPVYGFDVPKLLLIAVLCSAMAVLSAPEVPALWQRAGRELRALLVASGAFAVWMLVATLVSDASRLSVLGPDGRFVGTVAAFFPVVLVVAVPLAADTLRRLDRGALVLATVLLGISGYGVVQWLGLDPMPWAVEFGGPPVATFGNSNFVGAVLCVTVPMAMWLWYRRPPLRWLAVALAVTGGLAMLASGARLGWIASATAVVVFFAVYLTMPSLRLQSWFVALVPPLAPVVGLAAVVGGILIQDITGLTRLGYWRAAIPMWLDNPVVGVGLGRFAAFHRAYRPPESVIESGRDITVDSSHAWLIDLAATTGTPGALVWLAVLVAAGLVLRRVWLARDGVVHPLVSGLTAMLAAHGVQSSISVPTVVPVWLGWVLLGAVAAVGALPVVTTAAGTATGTGRPAAARRTGAGRTAGRSRSRSRTTGGARVIRVSPRALITGLLAAVVAMLVAVPGLAVWNASKDIGAASSLRGAERFDEARERVEVAVRETPWWPEPWRDLIRVATAQGDLVRAREALDAAVAADDRSRDTVFAALDLVIANDGWAAAEPWIRRLGELDPNGLDSNLTVATWGLQVGDLTTVEQALDVAALTVRPELPQWERYETLRASFDAAR